MKLLFPTLLLLILFLNSSQAQSWTTAKEKDGVKIETRFIDGWSIKQYKATVYAKSTMTKVVDAYWDASKRKQFMKRSIEVSNLKTVSSSEIITYNLGDAPWPVADRDNITRSVLTKPKSNVTLISMTSLPDFIPHKKGIVRVPRTLGYWRFTDMGDGRIKIEQQSVADLGGSVPDWIVNSTIIEGPYDTLRDMRTFLEK